MNEMAWRGFKDGEWTHTIDVRDFIQKNYTPYEGGSEFLAGATERTKGLNDKYQQLKKERAFFGFTEEKLRAAEELCREKDERGFDEER